MPSLSETLKGNETPKGKNDHIVKIPSTFWIAIIIFFPVIFWGFADSYAAESRTGDECISLLPDHRGANGSHSEWRDCLDNHRTSSYLHPDFADDVTGNAIIPIMCCFPLLILILIFSRVEYDAYGQFPDYVGPYLTHEGEYMKWKQNVVYEIKNFNIFMLLYILNLALMLVFFLLLNYYFATGESSDYSENREMLFNFDIFRFLIMIYSFFVGSLIFMPQFADHKNGFGKVTHNVLIYWCRDTMSSKTMPEDEYPAYCKIGELKNK